AAAEVAGDRLDGFDGLWLTAWPQDPGAEPLRRAAHRVHALGVPVVVSPTEPAPHFVAIARQRAALREQEERLRAEAAALEAAERRPRTYVHQMRGPRHRWWRP